MDNKVLSKNTCHNLKLCFQRSSKDRDQDAYSRKDGDLIDIQEKKEYINRAFTSSFINSEYIFLTSGGSRDFSSLFNVFLS